MSRIYWDSVLFIYLLEGHPRFGPRMLEINKKMVRRNDQLLTSTFTMAEVLTGQRKQGTMEEVQVTLDFFHNGGIQLIPFAPATAEIFAGIRATCKVSVADAIHLATAAEAQADLFLTNDRVLTQLNIPGIGFIAGFDAAVF